MRNLFRRIWRYLNYAPNTHSKLEEVRQLVSILPEQFPQGKGFWNVQVKMAAVESDLHYLKAMTAVLQNQLNQLQDHLRSSQPWLPSPGGPSVPPEGWLLVSLVGFFARPILVNMGSNDDKLLELLLDAGFQVYTEQKEIPPGFAVLRISFKDLEALPATDFDRLSPEVIDTAFSTLGAYGAEEQGASKKLIRDLRAVGYHWNVLVFQLAPAPAFRFAANLAETPDMSSGELFFFKSFELFERTYRWAQLVLPRFQHQDSCG